MRMYFHFFLAGTLTIGGAAPLISPRQALGLPAQYTIVLFPVLDGTETKDTIILSEAMSN